MSHEPSDSEPKIVMLPVRRAMRRPMPNQCKGYTTRMCFDGTEIVLRTAEYDDGMLAEILLDAPKLSLAQRTMLQSFAKAISVGLQHGIPLATFVETYLHIRSGTLTAVIEGNPRIQRATSIEDMILRELAIAYLDRQDLIQDDNSDDS